MKARKLTEQQILKLCEDIAERDSGMDVCAAIETFIATLGVSEFLDKLEMVYHNLGINCGLVGDRSGKRQWMSRAMSVRGRTMKQRLSPR